MTHETIIFGLVPFLPAVICLLSIVIYPLMGSEPRCGCPYGAAVNQGMTGQ